MSPEVGNIALGRRHEAPKFAWYGSFVGLHRRGLVHMSKPVCVNACI